MDIKTGALWTRLEDGATERIETGQYIGAAIPTDRGRYIALLTTGLYMIDGREVIKKLAAPEGMDIWLRFNDAKCDPAGRLWFGTMPLFPAPGRFGNLYKLDPGFTCVPMLKGVRVSNGLAWNAATDTMYFIDTPAKGADAFTYDIENGVAAGRRRVVEIADGYPDGMAIDAEDMLWIAIWGAGEVRRYNPVDGSLIGIVDVDARYTTSCCFGGPKNRTLFITSAMEGDGDHSHSGCVFVADVDISGTPASLFKESAMEMNEGEALI